MNSRKKVHEIWKEYLQVSALRAPLEARTSELSQRLLNPVDREDFKSASREFAENSEQLLVIGQRLRRLSDAMRAAFEDDSGSSEPT